MSTRSGSGFVSRVTITQTIVVTTVLVSAVLANTTELLPANGFHAFKATVASNDVAIAEISLHALILHQYQRSRYTAPVPAPISRTTCHPPPIEPSFTDT